MKYHEIFIKWQYDSALIQVRMIHAHECSLDGITTNGIDNSIPFSANWTRFNTATQRGYMHSTCAKTTHIYIVWYYLKFLSDKNLQRLTFLIHRIKFTVKFLNEIRISINIISLELRTYMVI